MEALAVVSDRPGYFVVDLPQRGAHHFRLPSLSRSAWLNRVWTERKGPRDAAVFEMSGALIGAAWRHETLELDAVFPDADPSVAALVQYSEAVQLELEEAGYAPSHIAVMGAEIAKRTRARASEQQEAVVLGDFSGPAKGETSSRASSSGSSSRGTPKRSTGGTGRRA